MVVRFSEPVAVSASPAKATLGADAPDWAEDSSSDLSGVCGALTTSILSEVCEVVCSSVEDQRLAAPAISLLLVGSNPAAIAYARSTVAAARETGVAINVHRLSEAAASTELLAIIGRLNADDACHGMAATHA